MITKTQVVHKLLEEKYKNKTCFTKFSDVMFGFLEFNNTIVFVKQTVREDIVFERDLTFNDNILFFCPEALFKPNMSPLKRVGYLTVFMLLKENFYHGYIMGEYIGKIDKNVKLEWVDGVGRDTSKSNWLKKEILKRYG